MKKVLIQKFKEAIFSVLPLSILILVISFAIAPMNKWSLIAFLTSIVFLIIGMGLYSLGADASIESIGGHIGAKMSGFKKLVLILVVALLIGIVVTIAEPNLLVLSSQVPTIDKWVLIISIAIGFGIMLMLAVLRLYIKVPLNAVLILAYGLAFFLLFFVSKNFIPLGFDSGGVTTGPITVPFVMALGIGVAASVSGSKVEENSFGFVGICTAGPVLAVLFLGIFYKTDSVNYILASQEIVSFASLLSVYGNTLLTFLKDVGFALAPIALVFVLFQTFTLKLPKKAILRIVIGLIYTYIGLTIFLTGVNVGFMPAGSFIGQEIVKMSKYLIVPVGLAVGAVLVLAEPAVHVLNRQVESITGGTIKRKTMLIVLSISVSLAVGMSMLRTVTGFNILYVLVPGYILALALTFFVPKTFTAIAFDSGAVATGPMTATFLLPFAIGACISNGGNIMLDAFGAIAFITLTPLLTVQILGLIYVLKGKRVKQIEKAEISRLFASEGKIIDLFDENFSFETAGQGERSKAARRIISKMRRKR